MTDIGKLGPSNRVRIWMPVYIGDYTADTIGLSHAEHGAYFLSMMGYWRKGEALTDKELRTITGKEFNRIAEFFILCDGRWHHKRLDIEIAKAMTRSDQMKTMSAKGVEKRRKLGQLPKKEP